MIAHLISFKRPHLRKGFGPELCGDPEFGGDPRYFSSLSKGSAKFLFSRAEAGRVNNRQLRGASVLRETLPSLIRLGIVFS